MSEVRASLIIKTKTMKETLNFAGFDCTIEIAYFSNKRPVIQLIGAADGIPVATASVNFPKIKMTKDEVAIKNYAENEGILEFLIANKVISAKPRVIYTTGHVDIPVHKLLKPYAK